MRRVPWLRDPESLLRRPLLALLPAGRARGTRLRTRGKVPFTSVSKPPTVQIIQPEVRKIVRVVGQPSFIEAFERTSIYPKLTGYIDKWIVDIGDKVKKGEVLATLFVPELVEDYRNEEGDRQARRGAGRAGPQVGGGGRSRRQGGRGAPRRGQGDPGQVSRPRSSAGTRRSSGSRTRLTGAWSIPRSSLNRPTSGNRASPRETRRRRPSRRRRLNCSPEQATLAKAKVDVSVAQADLAVATSEAKRIEAWVGYLTLTAPSTA